MNEEKITLKKAFDNESSLKILDMMENEEGISDVFRGRTDRLLASEYSLLIMYDNEVAGFVNLVREKGNYFFLFLDMGIKEKYRNKGIAQEVLQRIIQANIGDYIILETKVDNISANKIGCMLDTIEDRNYYLLQRNRLDEFISSNQMERLGKHVEQSSNKKYYID